MTTQETHVWTRVCATAAVAPGDATVLDVEPPVAVWNVDGEFYATDDTCTHEKYSLADSYIDGCIVECALHFAKFDLRTGESSGPPAPRGLRTYPVLVDGDEIFVDLSSRDAPSE